MLWASPQGPDKLRDFGGWSESAKNRLESKDKNMSTLLASAPPASSARLQTRGGSSGGGRGAEELSLQAQAWVWEGADRDLQGGNVRRQEGRVGPVAKASLRGALLGWRTESRCGHAPPPRARRQEGPEGAKEAAGRILGDAGRGGPGRGHGRLGLGQPQGGAGSRRRGNLGRGREGRGRVQMRSRRKRRWMKMKQDLQQEAEEEEAVVGGRKG